MVKMKKKTVSMAVAAVLSGVVLVTTAFAASSNVSGYEKLKASAFNIVTMKNYTAKVDFALKFDDEDFASGKATMKVQDNMHRSEVASVTMMGEVTDDSETYDMGDISVYKSWDGSYYSTENYGSYDALSSLEMTDNQKKLVSTIFDMLAGDTKNYFGNKNGEISVRLERNQIPEFFQAFMSVVSDEMSKQVKDNMAYISNYYDDDPASQFLLMMNDMSFDSVSVNSYVDKKDILNKLEVSVVISGKDESGKVHYMTTSVNCYITDIGTTVADTISLDKVTERNWDSRVYSDEEMLKQFEEMEIDTSDWE